MIFSAFKSVIPAMLVGSIALRVQPNFLNQINLILPVQPHPKKHSARPVEAGQESDF